MRSRWLWALLVVGAWGCSGSEAANGGDAGASAGAGSVNTEPDDEASYVFDQRELRTYDIKLSAADLAFLDADPAAEKYVIGSVEFEGKTIAEVGVRYKGSVGAFLEPCTAAQIGQKPTKKTGKCSIKLSFNEVDPEGRFYGMKKLNLHAMNQDRSMMRDRLGYALFRQFGVPASRAVHARVLINGKLEGLFAVVEQVDGRFTRSRFSEGGEGNLYKEVWPMHTDPTAYENALETNEDDAPSVQRMLDFHAAIGSGLAAMETWVDRDATLRYIAADRVLINDDGAFHWWCSSQGQGNNPGGIGNHNYYWYEAKDADRFWIIPWDMDSSMSEPSYVGISPEWTAAPASCAPTCYWPAQRAPSCDPLITLWAAWGPDYERAVDAFLAGPLAASNVDALLAQWELQIAAAAGEAAGTNGAPMTDQWQRSLTHLRTAIGSMRDHRGHAY